MVDIQIHLNFKNTLQDSLKKLREMDIQMIGDIFYVSYNSPYKVFNRRNEVMVEIEYVVEKINSFLLQHHLLKMII